MAATDSTQKKRNNYKLLVDPELKKGPKKVYRLNGKDIPGFPSAGPPKDPRTQKTVLGVAGSSVDMKLPRFKFDNYWEGPPPDRDVFFIGLNDSVRGAILREACEEVAPVHSIKFHRHPKTKTFLGAATVCFAGMGGGRKALSELDGKIVGGCYLRAELDDTGDHLKTYLEPVLKKCGVDKKQKPHALRDSKDGTDLSSSTRDCSDSEDTRTRMDSVSESNVDLSESEPDPSTSANTPLTPTIPRKDSDPFAIPSSSTKLYPFSSLHMLNVGTTPTEMTSSPGFVTPCTPGSVDSGISIRTQHSVAILSPGAGLIKKSFPALSVPPVPIVPPPLPPEEKAPPLPPRDSISPPPLPPLPPVASVGGGGIENISSDEDDENGNKGKQEVISPSTSPISRNIPSVDTFHTFDPSLGLQTLLASRTANSSSAISSSPKQLNTNYELEVEEISGDESPVMVYFEPLKVESVSDDEETTEVGGDDMEVCSDDEDAQDNVIEVNVRASRIYPAHNQMLQPPPPRIVPPQFPPHGFFQQGPFPPPPPPGFLPSLPPSHRHHPHVPLPPGNLIGRPFDSPPNPPRPFIKDYPSSQQHPLNGYIRSPSRYPPSRSFSKSRMLRNFASPQTKKEGISQDVLIKAIEQLRMIVLNDVQKKIVESSAYSVLDSHWEKRQKEKQAPDISVDHSSAGTTTDKEKPSKPLEPYRRMLPGMKVKTEAEQRPKEVSGVEENDEDEGEESSLPTPRKRLMNFKIPLVNRGVGQRRGQSLSVVARRRLFSGEEEIEDKPQKAPPPSKLAQGYYECSDISSSENFSSGSEDEGERSSDEDVASWEESDRELSEEEISYFDKDKEYREIFGDTSDSESNFEDFVAKTKSNKTQRRQSTTLSDASLDESILPAKTKPSAVKLKAKRSSKLKKNKPLKDSKADIEAVILDENHPVSDKSEQNKQQNKENLERVSTVVMEKKAPPPKPRYKKRTALADDEIVEEFAVIGPSEEDVQMFKTAFVRLRDEGNGLVDDMKWAHYPDAPPRPVPPPKTKRRRVMTPAECVDHMTGCARSEGYYKITMREKVKYLPHHRMKNTTTPAEKKGKSSGRLNRANQRKVAFSAGDISSDLAKYNQLRARKKQLKFAKSTIHNWGLFAMESIAADEMVIEYVGQMVRQAVADEREKRYEAAGIGSSYLFRVDHDYIIDATRRGNLARFINHCCDPNCYAKVINVGSLKKIVIYSKRDIAMGEEITYDYKFPIEDEKIPCLCGAPMCRGTLN